MVVVDDAIEGGPAHDGMDHIDVLQRKGEMGRW